MKLRIGARLQAWHQGTQFAAALAAGVVARRKSSFRAAVALLQGRACDH
ncbi:MAG: hypothetical protein ABSF93_13535 [Candidatus Sulfotelmatobacter sp.]